MLTSLVETISITHLYLSKTSKTAFRYPCDISMRLATTSMIVSLFFAAMLLKGLAHFASHRRNLRAFVLRIARVQHPHRDALLHRRQNRRRMQYLRPEVSKLGRFFKADRLYPQRIGADSSDRSS